MAVGWAETLSVRAHGAHAHRGGASLSSPQDSAGQKNIFPTMAKAYEAKPDSASGGNNVAVAAACVAGVAVFLGITASRAGGCGHMGHAVLGGAAWLHCRLSRWGGAGGAEAGQVCGTRGARGVCSGVGGVQRN